MKFLLTRALAAVETAEDRRARRFVLAMFRRAVKGELWAVRAITDAVEGTVTGAPPAIDQKELFEKGANIREFLRRVREKYEREE